ncbi:c2 domain-containing protein [Anaeramoeba flamelloides]|uniref:C2 domain-containing protein n=1 Tax=Anaeramoeba flamelloides TaxID=1746091 RepID=A0AAV7YUD3_9EUKA|nr:c2 domain-containing protein [Anaeramoeba flamelloides]KAJ6233780.1 c2 domain-containing protein [Anaeramoeba flamelloides]
MNKLYIRVVEAKGLRAADFGGKSDPFCTLSISDKEVSDKITKKGKLFTPKTKVIKKTVNPVWKESKMLYVVPGNEEKDFLRVVIYDWDRASKNDLLGMVKIPMTTFLNGKSVDAWYNVKPMKKEKAKGELRLITHYCPVGVPFYNNF